MQQKQFIGLTKEEAIQKCISAIELNLPVVATWNDKHLWWEVGVILKPENKGDDAQ